MNIAYNIAYPPSPPSLAHIADMVGYMDFQRYICRDFHAHFNEVCHLQERI
jgi:hypothetical protein